MTKPPQLTQLIEELRIEIIDFNVLTAPGAYVRIVYENNDTLEISNDHDLRVLLHDDRTAEYFCEALEAAAPVAGCTVELHGVSVPDDALTVLECAFAAVDEV